MKNGIWGNEEVKDLFETVEKVKEKNQSLRVAFSLHAQKYERKPNSVRNYYYHEIDNLKKDRKRLGEIGIDLSKHEKFEIKYFSHDEENMLMDKIDKEVQNGVSVRKACFNLSGGNAELMLRYQNKYRNFVAKEKPKEENNIIKFTKKRTTLTDGELQALFLGLVRLVKKNAVEEVGEKANIELRKAIVSLENKEREFDKLKTEFLKIKEENARLIDSLNTSRSEKAEKLKQKLLSKSSAKKIYN